MASTGLGRGVRGGLAAVLVGIVSVTAVAQPPLPMPGATPSQRFPALARSDDEREAELREIDSEIQELQRRLDRSPAAVWGTTAGAGLIAVIAGGVLLAQDSCFDPSESTGCADHERTSRTPVGISLLAAGAAMVGVGIPLAVVKASDARRDRRRLERLRELRLEIDESFWQDARLEWRGSTLAVSFRF